MRLRAPAMKMKAFKNMRPPMVAHRYPIQLVMGPAMNTPMKAPIMESYCVFLMGQFIATKKFAEDFGVLSEKTNEWLSWTRAYNGARHHECPPAGSGIGLDGLEHSHIMIATKKFAEDFGVLSEKTNEWIIEASWQSAFQCSGPIGAFIGVFICRYELSH
jgi:hypothetical protein